MTAFATLWTPQSQSKRQMRVSLTRAIRIFVNCSRRTFDRSWMWLGGGPRRACAWPTDRRVTAIEPSDTLRAAAIAADIER